MIVKIIRIAKLSQPEEEKVCGPSGRNAVSVPYGPVAAVLDRAVSLDVAYRPVGRILDRAVSFDISDRPVGGVLDGAVAFDVSDCPI